MKRIILSSIILTMVFSCAAVEQRLALKKCTFALLSVSPHSFTFSNLKVDFDIKVDNPNDFDAVLDKLVYTFNVNNTEVFSGTTGNRVNIKAKKSETFTTTITLEYNQIGQALAEAMKVESAAYRIDARAYVSTILGEISYPISIILN